MGKYNFYDALFVLALIIAVADSNVFTLLLLAIASILELLGVVKGIIKVWKLHSKGV